MPDRVSSLAAVIGALALVHAGLFLWYLQANIIQAPFADMSPLVRQFLEYREEGGWWHYLLVPQGEHRPVFMRLLVAVDIAAFGGVGYPFVVVAGLGWLGAAWLVWRTTTTEVRGAWGQTAGALAIMPVLTSVAAVDIAIPLMNSYPHVIALGIAALVLFDHGRVPGAGADWRRIAALAAACAAPFAHAEGWALWPVLGWLAWRTGAERRWLVAIVGIGAALLAVYWRGMSLPSLASDGSSLAAELAERARYLVTFTGLPLTRATAFAGPGRVFGAAVLLAGAVVVAAGVLSRGPNGRLQRLGPACVMFSMLMALMVTAGRAGDPVEGGVMVPVRYAVLLTPLHVGVWWSAVPWLARWWGSRRLAPVVAGGLVTACVALIGLQVAAGRAAVARTDEIVAIIERFRAGEADDTMRLIISDNLDGARRELEMMRRAGVYGAVR